MNSLDDVIEEIQACLQDEEDGQGYLWDAMKSGGEDILIEALDFLKELHYQYNKGTIQEFANKLKDINNLKGF